MILRFLLLLFIVSLNISIVYADNIPMSGDVGQRILQEFKNKLAKDTEDKDKSNKEVILTDEDFNVIIEDEVSESELESEKIKDQQNKKENKKKQSKNKLKEDKEKLNELKEIENKIEKTTTEKENLVNDVNKKDLNNIKREIINDSNNVLIKKNKDGILEKDYKILDTDVTENYLYSDDYINLMNNRINIEKNKINKDTDIPVLFASEKDILSFDTSDIPEEIMTYKRSTENKHIPTVILSSDLQNIAKTAIDAGDLSVIRGVLEYTKDPDFEVEENIGLLIYSIKKEDYTIARYLIYSGASLNKADLQMNTPLHVAVEYKNKDIVELLINNNANIDVQNIFGDTPLMLAIKNDNEEIVKMLLFNKADVLVKNNLGEDALKLCTKYGRKKLQQYIINILREE